MVDRDEEGQRQRLSVQRNSLVNVLRLTWPNRTSRADARLFSELNRPGSGAGRNLRGVKLLYRDPPGRLCDQIISRGKRVDRRGLG